MSAIEHLLTFAIRRGATETHETVPIRHAVIAGWTGSDAAAVEHHIKELEALGIARPASVPIFYRVAAARLTTAGAIEVPGDESSGEVEFALVQHNGRLYLGCGSDHTERKVEGYNVTVSKQMCDKPIAPALWAYDEVKPHWDRLVLRSFACGDGGRVLYQEGPVTAMRSPEELIRLYTSGRGLADGTVIFCGTLTAKGGIRPAPRFEFELEDPVRDLTLRHGYDIAALPVMG
jgi:2-keto-4-pentenoate hydratase/2-oxohepta-3-ene-1,7-dioic acid hydratase in catechol pathway